MVSQLKQGVVYVYFMLYFSLCDDFRAGLFNQKTFVSAGLFSVEYKRKLWKL